MTGSEFLKTLKSKVGQAYSGLLNDTFKANRLVLNSVSDAIEDKYKTLATEKVYDELRNLIVVDAAFSLTNDSVALNTSLLGIGDYLHLLAVKAHFNKPLFLTVIDATNTTPIVIELEDRNNLRTGEQIKFSGFLGNTNANGDFYIRKLNEFQFALYQDSNLQTPQAGNGNYTSGGTLSRIFFNYCKQYVSDTKISVLNTPTESNPRFEIANSNLRIYPTGSTEIRIDYIKKFPPIDVADNVVDLELVYPLKFLEYIIDKSSTIFFQMVRDSEGWQESRVSTQVNP